MTEKEMTKQSKDIIIMKYLKNKSFSIIKNFSNFKAYKLLLVFGKNYRIKGKFIISTFGFDRFVLCRESNKNVAEICEKHCYYLEYDLEKNLVYLWNSYNEILYIVKDFYFCNFVPTLVVF